MARASDPVDFAKLDGGWSNTYDDSARQRTNLCSALSHDGFILGGRSVECLPPSAADAARRSRDVWRDSRPHSAPQRNQHGVGGAKSRSATREREISRPF